MGETPRWITFKIDTETRTFLEDDSGDEAELTEQMDLLREKLSISEPRFVITNGNYMTDENPPRQTNKIIFIFWMPPSVLFKKAKV